VAVSATHRRRGLMRRMLDELHAEAVRRGEVAAVLWAAEASIYGNLGYGPTHPHRLSNLDTGRVRFRDDAPVGGTVRYADAATAEDVLPAVVERTFRLRPAGLLPRPSWWRRLFLRLEASIEDQLPPNVLVHLDEDGAADGFAVYTSEERWDTEVARHKVTVEQFAAATPEARAGLWRVLCSLDLVAEIETDVLPADDPLPWMLADPRAVRTPLVVDGMWLKLLDVPGLLGARTYASDEVVVVEAGELGRWALGGHHGCAPAEGAPADVWMSPVELAAISLGGTQVGPLAAAGRVLEHAPGAVGRLDRLLRADPAPACTTHF
jgi:predicted acetyltransferase